jgi:hypothetical protein
MCYNNYVCVKSVYGIISAIINKLILPPIIEFQCDKINYVPTMTDEFVFDQNRTLPFSADSLFKSKRSKLDTKYRFLLY